MMVTTMQEHKLPLANKAVATAIEVADTTAGISPTPTSDAIIVVDNDSGEFMSSELASTATIADSVAYPLRKGSRRKAQSNWKGTFRISNTDDDFPAYDPRMRFDPEGKYPVEYTCDTLPNPNGNWRFSETLIDFDFEIALAIGEDVRDNIRAFEWSVLDAVVTDMGLDRCTLGKQRINVGRRELSADDNEDEHSALRHRRMKSLSSPTIINRVASTPQDQLMREWALCMKFSAVLWNCCTDFSSNMRFCLDFDTIAERCEWLRHDPSKTMCVPVRGTLTAGFRAISGDDVRKDVHEYVQSVLKRAVNTNDNVKVNNILDAMYTSDRIKANSGNGGISRASGGGGIGEGVITAFISVSVLFVLISSILYARRSRREEDIEEEPESPRSPHASAKERPAVEAVVTSLGIDSGSSSIPDEENPDTAEESPKEPTSSNKPKVDDELEYAEATLTASTSTSSGEGSPASPGLVFYSVDSTDEIEPEISPREVAAPSTGSINVMSEPPTASLPPPDLPPRPPAPLQRKNSKNLKKRRKKKKKKKKKTVLKRVNSRENVNAMEAIPESADEDSEFGSEYSYGDSEYSTDDESGFGSRPSSGCSTPVKGGSTMSLSKKQLSPQDELFPSDVFAEVEYEFDIQAPDLLADNQEQQPLPPKSKMPSGMGSDRRTPSGSGNKIRPLPAPWV